ncbi:CocE/NonD family hydrolase [Kutzneria sp. NPDC052558]|uniref:CocE/NonD family hydrolase n=1 Tax=Kutzneria sp. NPDC052558 TaxID=3364121 RepID=UPI0037CC34BC
MSEAKPAGLSARALGVVHRLLLGLPPARTAYTVQRGLRVPTRDGAELVTDHYAPMDRAYGTVLIRTPYPRGLPESLLHGRMLAARGYHTLIQSVRGTGGSTGDFRPIAQEAADAQDVVAWLRTQPWFTGTLATLGGSYLGWAQWALLQDPPPELRAAVVLVGPHDFRRVIRGTGSFALGDFFGWSSAMVAQRQGMRAVVAARRHVAAALRARSATAVAGAPWFTQWLDHKDIEDPFWQPYQAPSALRDTKIPVLLVGGWHDVFVDQTLEQYRRLREHNPDVALTIGPWTHMDTAVKAARVVDPEALAWFDQHIAGAAPRRKTPVRVHVTGAGQWRSLAAWPPATTDRVYGVDSTGLLTASPGQGAVEFDYNPDDPTPSVGGRHMSPGAGRQDNTKLEQRADVVVFTSAPFDHDTEIVGAPRLRIDIGTTAPLFARLCEVDSRGRSWNVTETFTWLSGPGEVELGQCAHRFRAGSRLRLQLSGGAYPRYSAHPEPVHYRVACSRALLTVPVA